MDRFDGDHLTGTVRWLEDEQKQSKDQIAKLQTTSEQLLVASRDHSDRLHVAEETVIALSSQLSHLPRIEEDLRQTKAHVERLKMGQGEDLAKLEETIRGFRTEVERDRDKISDLYQRQETVESGVETRQAKLQAFEEANRRHHENFLQIQQRLQDMVKKDEDLEAKLLRSMEINKRAELEIVRLDRELETMRKQDEVAIERIQILSDQVKRLEEKFSAVSTESDLRQGLSERVDTQRAEIQRLEKQLAEFLPVVEEQKERLQWASRVLGQLDVKAQASNERLAELQQQIWDNRQQVNQQLGELLLFEEQQKKRQINDLEQALRDLKKHSIKPAGN